ncbi:MAG: DNA repair protein RadA, partial [Desulfobacterales bacterium]
MKKPLRTVFVCQACGYQAPKWMGKCPDCGSWDAFAEESRQPHAGHGGAAGLT